MTDHAMSTVADQVTTLHARVEDIIGLIRALQDDLIEQYDASHSKPYTGGFDDDYSDEARCCIGTLDCVAVELTNAEKSITSAMELFGLV
jgi:hypothetical protein